jgi:hypothetical protein
VRGERGKRYDDSTDRNWVGKEYGRKMERDGWTNKCDGTATSGVGRDEYEQSGK